MHFSFFVVLGALATGSFAIPASRHVVHEERYVIPPGWSRQARLPQDTLLPVKIGLTQSNLDKAYDVLSDVSDPDSPNYGKHWTDDQIAKFFAPSQHTIATVRSWLNSSGISTARVKHSHGSGWLLFDATVSEMEALLRTEYWRYEHTSGKPHISCHEYSVPEHIKHHIDIITPTIHFDAQVPKDDSSIVKRDESDSIGFSAGPRIGKTVPAPPRGSPSTLVGGQPCSQGYVTTACLRALYNIPHGTKNLSSLGIVEYFPQTFLQSDLNIFQSYSMTNDAGMPVGTQPNIENIDGGSVLPASQLSGGFLAEGDLDLQVAMGLVYPQQVTLFQVGDNGTASSGQISFNNFLDGIDKSYCTYKGGDTLGFDKSYPDSNGYNHTADCGVWAPSHVISTSYGYNEHDLSPAYEQRQCNEYLKLGLKGVSIVYSSGDNGVAGNGAQCIASDGTYTNGSSGAFNPVSLHSLGSTVNCHTDLFKALSSNMPLREYAQSAISETQLTCQVTTVGATQLQKNNTATAGEVACESVIYSGGGFSNTFAMPPYQKIAVKSYFKNYPPPYGADRFNNSTQTRGFPDVSANGANYIISLAGEFVLVYGTSASAPTFASVVTLINNEYVFWENLLRPC